MASEPFSKKQERASEALTITQQMASSLYRTDIPLPSDTDEKPLKLETNSTNPIYIVTRASQLPTQFLNPSPKNQLVIGFDCVGVDSGHDGKLCIMQLAFPDAIYLVDGIQGEERLIEDYCKPALESKYVKKVVHGCRPHVEVLYFQFGIRLYNVVDTQIVYSLLEEQEGRTCPPDDYISFGSLLADSRCCGISLGNEEVQVLVRQDPEFWTRRPLFGMMVQAAADDVRFLLYIYHKIMGKLNRGSLWDLGIRGTRKCRCFCMFNLDCDRPSPAFTSGPDEDVASLKVFVRGRETWNIRFRIQIGMAAEKIRILSVLRFVRFSPATVVVFLANGVITTCSCETNTMERVADGIRGLIKAYQYIEYVP